MQTPRNKGFTRSIVCLLLSLGLTVQECLAANDTTVEPLTTATPQSQELDGAMLNAAVDKIKAGQYGDLDSLLILRNNHLVLEEYFSPQYQGRDYRFSVRSVTKSVTSALIGIAIAEGKIDSVDANVLEFFPEYKDIKNLDERKKRITLKHLLSMTAGFEWDELTAHYADPVNNSARKMTRTEDWLGFVLDLPMSHEPGERLEYNSGASFLLSSILQKSTGMSVEDYAWAKLFSTLGFKKKSWSLASNGLINTMWGLTLRRRDMARVGILYLNEGRWGDRQLIPAQWIRESTRAQANGKDGTPYAPFAYGYQWWRLRNHASTVSKLAVNDMYFANGDGGQHIFVIPHLELIVVTTGENHGDDWKLAFELMRDEVFPAVLK